MDIFFTQAISDSSERPILLNNSVDGEVSIHRLHLLVEAQSPPGSYSIYGYRQCEQ